MREAFFQNLYQLAQEDRRIILLLGDVGALTLDKYRQDLPDRCVNMGIAEENMMGVAAGLALSGKVVYVFSHAIFATASAFEQIKLDICLPNLPVKIIGLGPGLDYSTLGPSHHAQEDIALMRVLPNMTILSPADNLAAAAFARVSLETHGPVYIRLDREGEPLAYATAAAFEDGLWVLRWGNSETCIVATGRPVLRALEMAKEMDATVVDLYRIKPLTAEVKTVLGDLFQLYPKVITLEEHNIIGGIGSALAEVIAERHGLVRRGVPDSFVFQCGPRRYLQDAILGKIEPS